MKRKKISVVISGMTALLVVQSPATVLADAFSGVEAQASEEILTGEGQELPGEAEFYTEEILPGTADEVLTGTQDVEEETFSGTADIARAGNATVQEGLDRAEQYLQSAVTSPVVDTIGGEWSVMAMARAGVLPGTTKANYLANLYMKLDATEGKLDLFKYTEYSRVIMALASLGMDATNVNGYNLVKALGEYENVINQGINGSIFALIALDTRNYELPQREGEGTQTTRELLIQDILSKELSGGGWTLYGNVADADVTAMAIQGLAPYTDRAEINAAVNRGLDKLAAMQAADGGYTSTANGKPEKNLESTAQVVIALSAVDVSLLNQERFMKNGQTLLEEVLHFQLADGSFEHTKGGGSNAMATDQGTLALVAWTRAANGQTSLYDMTDMGMQEQGEETAERIEAFRKKLNALPQNLTLADKKTVYDLKIELEQMKNFEEKESFRSILKEKNKEIARQEKEVKELDQRIWNEINPLYITLEDRETVEELMKIYANLPEYNQSLVTNAEDLTIAKKVVDKLEKGVLAKEIFEKAKTARKDYVYEGDGYQIRIQGEKVTSPADMNAKITLEETEDGLSFTVEESGDLPGEVELTLFCQLKDGVYQLYRGQQEEQWAGVSDGVAVCDISRGGSYVLRQGNMDFADEEEALTGTEDAKTTGDALTGTKKTSTGKKSITGKKTTSGKKTVSNTTEAKVKDGVVEKSEFEKVQGKDRNLKIKGEMGEDKPYTLIVNGKDIETVKDMKVGIQEDSTYGKEIQKLAEDPYIFSFAETGDFPGKMQVTLTTGQKDGEYLLLKYDVQERKAAYIQKVTVKDEKTKCILETGGDYFIAKRVKTKSLDELEAEEKEEKAEVSADAETSQSEKIEEPEKTVEKTTETTDTEKTMATLSQKEEKSSMLTVILAGIAVVLAGIGAGVFWYIRKKRQ